ncbi:MAG: lactonase family protein, partial [Lentisphaerae bacterium]|nr:lactonase family protein [Lentisphaerota bacterium]
MERILLGTYTKNTSEGIYSIDLVDGHLVNLSLVAKAQNPTYLDYD